MQQLTINIPDNKVALFRDVVKSLGFTIENDNASKSILTESQKMLVDDARRQLRENPNSFLDWDEARKNFKFD